MKIILLLLSLVLASNSLATMTGRNPIERAELTYSEGEKVVVCTEHRKLVSFEIVSRSGVKYVVPQKTIDELKLESLQLNSIKIIGPTYKGNKESLHIQFSAMSPPGVGSDKRFSDIYIFSFDNGVFYEGWTPPVSITQTKEDKITEREKRTIEGATKEMIQNKKLQPTPLDAGDEIKVQGGATEL